MYVSYCKEEAGQMVGVVVGVSFGLSHYRLMATAMTSSPVAGDTGGVKQMSLGKNSVGIDNNMFQISQAAMRLKTFSQQEKAALATSPVDHSKIVVTLEGNSQEAYERGEAHEEHEEVQEEEASQGCRGRKRSRASEDEFRGGGKRSREPDSPFTPAEMQDLE
ncbi:hypothetical protein WJX79_004565 [Trebouxia sp. C0005]